MNGENGDRAPATRGDLAALRVEMKAMEDRLNERHEMLRSEMQHSFDDLKEVFRDSQTELLKAFYNYAQSNDERVTSAESESSALKRRLAIVESRLTDIEKRLNTPSAG